MPAVEEKLSLSEILSPLSEEEFFSRHWRRQPAHVRGDDRKLVRMCGSGAGIPMLTTALRNGMERAGNVGRALCKLCVGNSQQDGWSAPQTEIAVGFADALGYVESPGDAPLRLYFADEIDRRLATITAEFASAIGVPAKTRIQLSIFFHPPGSPGTPAHFDDGETFQLQVSGSKEWSISKYPLLSNIDGSAYSSKDGYLRYFGHGAERVRNPESGAPILIDDVETIDFTANPGDIVYMPPGTLHTTRSSDESSLGITFGISRPSLFDVCSELLRIVVDGDEAGGSIDIRTNTCVAREGSRIVADAIAAASNAAAADSSLVRRAFAAAEAKQGFFQTNSRHSQRKNTVSAETRMKLRPGTSLAKATISETSMIINTGGAELEFSGPHEVRFAEGLMSHRKFCAADLARISGMAEQEASELLANLQSLGVVVADEGDVK